MLPKRISSTRLIAAIAFAAGCSSFSATINKIEYDAGNASGGSTNSGGTTSAGGSTAPDSGSSTGGTSETSTNSSSVAGASSLGGATGVGGQASPGGTLAVGGNSSLGGASSPASTAATGGALNVGGSSATAASAQGGTTPLSTSSTAGGVISAGGIGGTGGTSSTQNSIKVLTSGAYHSCVQYADGKIKCWGSNVNGQLGNGTTVDSSVPVDVDTSNMSVETTVASTNGTCAILTNNTLQCWGLIDYGQLGDGTAVSRSLPAPVVGLPSTVMGAGLGFQHGCALLNNASVKCWGSNFKNALGNHSSADSLAPTDVSNVDSARSISVGGYTSCVVLNGGSVQCWGDNSWGQLGNGSTESTNIPVTVLNIPTASSARATQVSVGGGNACALLSDNTAMCWGSNGSGSLGNSSNVDSSVPVQVVGITDATVIAAGGGSTCASLAAGTIRCWGGNRNGELGNNAHESQLVPVSVVGPSGSGALSDVSAISLNSTSACALTSANKVYCWGQNLDGELGNGNTIDSPIPVLVSGI